MGEQDEIDKEGLIRGTLGRAGTDHVDAHYDDLMPLTLGTGGV